MEPVRKKAKPRASRRHRLPQAVTHEPANEAARSGNESSSSSSSSSSTSSSSSSSPGAPALAEAVAGGQASASSSGTFAVAEPIASSQVQAPASSSGSVALAAAQPEPPEEIDEEVGQIGDGDDARASHKRRRDIGEQLNRWYRLTPAGPGKRGYQMTCMHPWHQDEASLCTKSRTSSTESDATIVQALKRWAQLGESMTSKSEHKDAWKQVVKEMKDGSLPDEGSLDTWLVTVDLSME